MMSIEITVDGGSLRRSNKGKITGICFVSIDGQAFPGKSWDDYPIIVIGWWAAQLLELARGESEALLPFMDGPFRIRAKKTAEADMISMELFEGDCLERTATVRLSGALNSLQGAATALLSQCDANNWSDADILALRANVAELQRDLAPEQNG